MTTEKPDAVFDKDAKPGERISPVPESPAVDFGAMIEEFAAAQNKAMAALYRGEKGKASK